MLLPLTQALKSLFRKLRYVGSPGEQPAPRADTERTEARRDHPGLGGRYGDRPGVVAPGVDDDGERPLVERAGYPRRRGRRVTQPLEAVLPPADSPAPNRSDADAEPSSCCRRTMHPGEMQHHQ